MNTVPDASSPDASTGTLPRSRGGDIYSELRGETAAHPVLLYMKGTPDAPMCGFSARVVKILNQLGVEFTAVDILEDPEKREALRTFSNWPTFPQLYVNGALVGGCDIVSEMYREGELVKLLAPTP